MLKLVNVKKDYKVADTAVHALKGVSVEFRSNEFVSILGASGCGKTTLLNIIGGLDHYTSGDLIVRGKSTKNFTDSDWDVYRNHRIGFIFQSYNLIPHQTVLQNVEMSLTIAGVSAKERKKRAIDTLERVGLKEHINKLPNQLSGGQMQRVAIARALVNNPEILLADEPTGALDSETSIQIMELIKEISGERLVIMVTHNPELAEQYSSRIVRLHDGLIVSDSNPYDGCEEIFEEETSSKKRVKEKNKSAKEKASMSYATSLNLSFKNLMSKRGRTLVTSIAGSIGIIGVSLVLAISAGIQNYITSMQDDMLSGNPVMIRETSYNIDALTGAMKSEDKKEIIKEPNKVYIDSYVESLAKMGAEMANMLINNNITAEYVDYVASMPSEYYAAMNMDYGIDMLHNIYTDFTYEDIDGQIVSESMSIAGIQALYTSVLKETDYKDFTDYISLYTDIFAPLPESASENENYIASQYDIKAGRIAKEKDEIMIVLDKSGEATDLTLAQLGYLTQNQFMAYAYKATGGEYNESDIADSVSYDDILNKSFTWYPNDSIYSVNKNVAPNSEYGFCGYIYNPYGNGLNDGLNLKIVGILQPKDTISYGCLSSGVYYTRALAEYAIDNNKESAIVKYADNEQNKGNIYSGYYTYNYGESMEQSVSVPMGICYKYSYVYEGTEKSSMGFVGASSQSQLYASMMGGMMGGSSGSGESSASYKVYTTRNMGGEEVPNRISVYPIDFDCKDLVTEYLDKWNEDGDITYNSVSEGKEITVSDKDRENVTYTDSLEIVIGLINSMINIVTYGLVAFTSISLVVSSVMIGVITYVSVVERTKEIGILRAMGARKKDIKRLFKAETFIIGLFAGAIGIGFTYLISIPVNIILHSLTGIASLAALPPVQAALMVLISIVLTLISGLVPASAAAKKDPVIALRTE